MASGKIQRKHGFEFFCERWWEFVVWSFRPEGAELWAQFRLPDGRMGLKPQLVELLKDPAQARSLYERTLTAIADVDAARQRLEAARVMRERFMDPQFDPGGRRSNPGAVARDLSRAAASGDRIQQAEAALVEAHRVCEILKAGNRRRR